MKVLYRPIPATILYGMVCSILFFFLSRVFSYILWQPVSINLTLGLFAAGYAALLSRWSEQRLTAVGYPMLFLFLTVFMVPSVEAFILLVLSVIGWIRSGLCYRQRRRARLAVELLLGAAGGALAAFYQPASPLDWALYIWLLFLLQGFYLTIFDSRRASAVKKSGPKIDPFERASRQAEDILSESF